MSAEAPGPARHRPARRPARPPALVDPERAELGRAVRALDGRLPRLATLLRLVRAPLRAVVVGASRSVVWLRLVVRFGPLVPRADERIWIVPRECRQRVSAAQVGGIGVVGGQWPEVSARQPHEHSQKMMDLIEHFRDGTPWSRSRAYRKRFGAVVARGEALPPEVREDLRAFVAECERYDRLAEMVRREGRLRTARELHGLGVIRLPLRDRLAVWREPGGVRISIRPDGVPVWSGDGSHRLALAIALDLPIMPARLMAIHPDALPGWRRRHHAGRRRPPSGSGSG